MSFDAWSGIAKIILEGFNRHYSMFRQYSRLGQSCFEDSDWKKATRASLERIQGYEQRVAETVAAIQEQYPKDAARAETWPRVKITFIGLLMNHLQAECAETFYNSVACRVLHRNYYNIDYIFWRPAISTEYLEASQPTYRSHYPERDGLRRCLLEILTSFGVEVPFENLRRDLRYLERAVLESRNKGWKPQPNIQFQVLGNLFLRNKAAYIVGRQINGADRRPFVIPLIRNDDGTMTVDCLLQRQKDVAVLFSFSRAYFLVDMEVPSAYVRFLMSIMPRKSPVDLYAMLGLHRRGRVRVGRSCRQDVTQHDAGSIAAANDGVQCRQCIKQETDNSNLRIIIQEGLYYFTRLTVPARVCDCSIFRTSAAGTGLLNR